MMEGTRSCPSKDDPRLRELVAGRVIDDWFILTATRPKYSEYSRTWQVHYTVYVIPEPCSCCRQPRGAGSLHA